jgi:stage III sporulation protein AB
MGFIALSAAMTGVFLASGLSGRVLAAKAAEALLGYLSDRLRYLRPTVAELIDSACELESLAENRFLPLCRDEMHRGASFPSAWRTALSERPGALGVEEAALLSGLGQVLGSADLDSQLDALACARSRLEAHIAEAEERRDKHGKLYRSLGVLTGVGIVVLLI